MLSLIADKVTQALDSKALMRESLPHHREVPDAIRAGDGTAAARISRRTPYDYYAGSVPEEDRTGMLALLKAERALIRTGHETPTAQAVDPGAASYVVGPGTGPGWARRSRLPRAARSADGGVRAPRRRPRHGHHRRRGARATVPQERDATA